MGLTIDGATHGYDYANMQKSLSAMYDLNTRIKNAIETESIKLRGKVDEIWKGRSADSFKNKIDRDSATFSESMDILSQAYESSFYNIMQSMDNGDAELAAAILGEDYTPSSSAFERVQHTKEVVRDIKLKNRNIIVDVKDGIVDTFESFGEGFVRTGATTVMLATSLWEGLENFAENIVDGLAFAGTGIAGGCVDAFNGVRSLFDDDYTFESTTKKWMNEYTLPFIAEDFSKQAMDNIVGSEFYQNINDYAYSPFQRGGIAYKIGTGVGEVAGNVLLGIATGGGSKIVTTVAAGVSGMGKSSEKNTAKMMEENGGNFTTEELLKLGGATVGNGLIDAGSWYLTFGGGSKDILKGASIGGNSLYQEAAHFGKLLNTNSIAKEFIFAGKAYGGEGLSVLIDGEYDWSSANEKFIADTFASVLYDSTIGGNVGAWSKTLGDNAGLTSGAKKLGGTLFKNPVKTTFTTLWDKAIGDK